MSNHQHRFIEVVRYIEANLDTDINIDKLCHLVHLSKFHFHRQCSAYFGMSVISLARLLRLKRAAYQLAYRDEKNVLDVALANGYESHEAFSRAFKKHFDMRPSQFRKTPNWDLWQTQYEPILTLRNKIVKKQQAFQVDIVDFPKTKIAVIEHRGSPNLLGATIQRFIEWRKLKRLPPSKSKTFNLVYDDSRITPPEAYRFDVCCQVDTDIQANEQGVVGKEIPAGKCAKIRHVGSEDTLGTAIDYLYANWLEASEYELRDFPIFLERVSFFPEVAEHEMTTDVYLPIL
ncbi:AraC family transcriptional regulator [Thalassotalea euphylliae]|uniref:Helix-turn-helix domain-containing protein n=1 Tax=Thalassotalea euphylliae TaxID=1655234 RepID=A0A3E0TXI5_9GAMM|nr:AraC family transcriptional regulator [Thalassotalea euphylliae]REL29318.1 helix-turn-helix domain-containing protein [Thalassotalea euphylliae]